MARSLGNRWKDTRFEGLRPTSTVERREQGNNVPPLSTIYQEIFVGGEDLAGVDQFSHADGAAVETE